jgi:hypothetical protein
LLALLDRCEVRCGNDVSHSGLLQSERHVHVGVPCIGCHRARRRGPTAYFDRPYRITVLIPRCFARAGES